MGGKAFSAPAGLDNPALDTPRLTPDEYHKIKEKYCAILQEFFEEVETPPEAPGKPDYGDVDFLVEKPRKENIDILKELTPIFKARRTLSNGPTKNFAVPLDWKPGSYAQIDVHSCEEGYLQWELFTEAYGDLWQILGRMHRGVGLTSTDKGLHLRIAEIEPLDRKASMVFLTKDPRAAMEFLGLDSDAYFAGFKDEESLFQWCASGRFFYRGNVVKTTETANDRQRLRKRPMFKRFVDEWVPAHPELGETELSRETVEAEALKTFEKEADAQQLVHAVVSKTKEQELWSRIASIVPEEKGDKLNLAIRALKRWVWLVNGKPSIREEADMKNDLYPMVSKQLTEGSEKELFAWIRENWFQVRMKEKQRISAIKDENGAKKKRKADVEIPRLQVVQDSPYTGEAA